MTDYEVTEDLLAALQEVMQWIDGWSPDFIYDDEWAATKEKALSAIAKVVDPQ